MMIDCKLEIAEAKIERCFSEKCEKKTKKTRGTQSTWQKYRRLFSVVAFVSCIYGCESSTITRAKHGLNATGDGTCQLVVMLPFTDTRKGPPQNIAKNGVTHHGRGVWPDAETLSKNSYALMASAQLAANHFNEKDSSVVPELAGHNFQTCSVRFSDIIFLDTSHREKIAANNFIDLLLNNTSICAVVGPETPKAIDGLGILADSIGVPVIDYGSMDNRFSQKDEFPALVRIFPDMRIFAEAMAEYLGNTMLNRKYVSIISDHSDYSTQFESFIRPLEGALGLNLITANVLENSIKSIDNAISVIVKGGHNTIVLVTEQPALLEHIARMADEKGLIGENYFWVIAGRSLPRAYLERLRAAPNSPLDRMLKGSAVFRIIDPFMYQRDMDRFLINWMAQDSSLVSQLNSLHPLKGNNPFQVDYFVGTDNYFQMNDPAPLSSYIYDSVILTGISACELLMSEEKIPAKLEITVNEMLGTRFLGASGNVSFEEGNNGRSPGGLSAYGVYNIRHGDIVNGLRG
mmetsp:Transcript_21954/g.31819  ORF Transcript_21954/g.31819 Transcript_21954/m.31819 type:complete len:518 (-) Transcript_21954:2783-4336(-)